MRQQRRSEALRDLDERAGDDAGYWRDEAHRMWRALNEERRVRGELVASKIRDMQLEQESTVSKCQPSLPHSVARSLAPSLASKCHLGLV